MVKFAEYVSLNAGRLLDSLASAAKVAIASRYCNRDVKSIVRPNKEIVILGNGPSLKRTIAEKKEFFRGKDLMCVNFSVCSPFYEDLQPRYYIATDPLVYTDPQQCRRMFGTIGEKTSWELHLFVPYRYRKIKMWRSEIEANRNICVHFVNTTPVTGTDAVSFFLYRCRLGMPRPHNVLIPALMASLWMGYKTIYTAGVEHSWHTQLWIGDDNSLMINDTHFYDPTQENNRRHGTFRMHTLFRQLYIAFGGYHTIERFSRKVGARIFNITPGSFIDAFERVKI